MKKRIFLVVISLCLTLGLWAQGKPQQRQEFSPEKFNQMLEEFVIREAKLTSNEAQKFFPLLHEMLDKQRDNMDKSRALMKSLGAKASEAAYEEAVEKSVDYEIANKKLEKVYARKFHAVLSWEKIFKVRHALDKFHMEVLRHFAPPRQDFSPNGWKWGRNRNWTGKQRPQK